MSLPFLRRERRVRRAVVAFDPLRTIVRGYAIYVFAGWILLCMPFSRQAGDATPLDHLFTATSAVSTTGLVTVSTADSYNFFGELVIATLIQLGGLGYMTVSSFIVLSATGDLSKGRKRVSEAAVSAPDPHLLGRYLKLIVVFTAVVETAGAIAMYPVFRSAGAPQPVWQAVFHSISSFCTAGFSLFNNSFEDCRGNAWLNIVVSVLCYLGAIGFIVVQDFWHSVRSRSRKITLTSKIILASTAAVSLGGTALFFFNESSIQQLPLGERLLAASFQVMNATTTAGYNSIPIGGVDASSLFLLTIVMIIGASPSGTGGGVKTTTVTALWAQMMSVVRREPHTTFARREIPEPRLRAATASATYYLFVLAVGVYCLSLVEDSPWGDQVFECASALGTVGLSRGITAGLTDLGKALIVMLMFLGRVGPIVMGMSLARPRTITWRYPGEDVVVG